MRPKLLLLLLLPALVLACSGYQSYREAEIAEQRGNWDQAVLHYLELVDQYPSNLAYRAGLLRSKIRASQEHFERAKTLHELGSLEIALREYLQAIQLDPSNQYAQVEYIKARRELDEAHHHAEPGSLDEMKAKARRERPQPPTLNPRSKDPISLAFPNPVSVIDIYKALGKAFGINIQFDPKLRPTKIAIELEDVTAQEALEIVMHTAGHFYKVLSDDTIIVVEDTPQNRRQYEDLVIQTFFLSNAEVRDMLTLLRSLVGAKNIASNEQLNAIVLRDTADKVKVAERIIETNDKARGEVVVDVELLQINTKKIQELGVSLSSYQVTQSLDQDPPLRASDLEFINQGDWVLNLPSLIYDFVKSSTEAQLLASPQVRISDGEQASLIIGDQVPIPVTTFNSAQTVGGNIVPITSFQYQDVGIRLQIEPRLHHNKEVTLKIQVEVANLNGTVEGAGGQAQPIIGTRNIESTIRLRDGETNFLAGLIRDDLVQSDQGIPGLSDIPVLGRLFSKKGTDKQRTDLVLTLTPHIVRTPDISEEDLLPIWVGTEANITFRGGSPQVESDVEGPFDEEEDDDAERIRDMIRRRIQSLPEGLRQDEGGRADQEPGSELVPSGAPRDRFQEEQQQPPDDNDEEPPDIPVAWSPAEQPLRPVPAVWTEGVASPFRLAAEGPGPQVRLSLQPVRPVVAVGQELEVAVVAETATPLSHLPLTIRFDPTQLAVDRVLPGPFLGDETTAKVLSDHSRPGVLVLGASRLGGVAGVSGHGVVARVVFKALAVGETRLRFRRAKALDSDLEPLAVAKAPVQVRVVETAEEVPLTAPPREHPRPQPPAGRRDQAARLVA